MATSVLPVIGKPAPNFSLPATTGETISIKQYKGKKTVVLFFYPKDETAGCTKEACDFRDRTEEFEQNKTVVFGISTDPMESHNKFLEKQKLSFPLLSDEDALVSKLFGVYKQRNLYGKKVLGIERTTFIIDRSGRIAQIYPKVKVDGHAQQVLEFVRED